MMATPQVAVVLCGRLDAVRAVWTDQVDVLFRQSFAHRVTVGRFVVQKPVLHRQFHHDRINKVFDMPRLVFVGELHQTSANVPCSVQSRCRSRRIDSEEAFLPP